MRPPGGRGMVTSAAAGRRPPVLPPHPRVAPHSPLPSEALFYVDGQLVVLATLAVSLLLFVTDTLRYDLVAVLVVLVLSATRALDPREAFSGFADPAVVLIASMYVFGLAVQRWGLTELLATRLLGVTGEGVRVGEGSLTLRITLVSGLLSSVLSNTGIVATMIPVLSDAGRKLAVPVSRLLIPLAYGSLLGGLLTVVGTSTNVAIDGKLREAGERGLGLSEFTHLGLILLGVGVLYFLGPGRWLLPKRSERPSLTEHYDVPKFVTEVLVEPGSTLIHRSVSGLPNFEELGLTVVGIVREGGERVLAPGPYNRIRSDDVLIIQGDPDALVTLRDRLGLRQRTSVEVGGTRLQSDDVVLVESVVPAGSPLLDKSLAETSFRDRTGVNVLAISHAGVVQPGKLAERRLEIGDALLLQGHSRDVERLRESRELLVLGELDPPKFGRGAVITLSVLAGVLLSAALGWLPLSVAALGGAVALVLTGCVRAHDAQRAVDYSVLILVGGMLALGTAFEKYGLGGEVAERLLALSGEAQSPRMVLGLLAAGTVLLTQLTTNVTAGVLMTPVALQAASQLGVDDRAFVMAVVAGASLAFMSPVAHQANTMVVGPGDYKFTDFLRVGTPLTLLMIAVVVTVLPWLWPLTPI